MPELPEVQTVVQTLRPKAIGKRILRVDLKRRDILTPPLPFEELLTGRTITDITRRGKRIVFSLSDGNRFFIHLGMTGRLSVVRGDVPLLRHTHLLVDLGDLEQLRFIDPRRFGGIHWLGTAPCHDGNIGPEPLKLRPQQLTRQLSKTTRAIKNALLDQSVIAGLGNIYVDESLFAARVHPLRPANRLSADEISRLNRAIKLVLRRAIAHRGSTLRDYRDADGQEGSAQKLHRVYGRESKPCVSCKTPIARIVLGGRSTCFCPRCQPPPA